MSEIIHFANQKSKGITFTLFPSLPKLSPFLPHSRFARPQDSLSTICNLQFAEYIRDMIAHCLETEHKLLCDFFITLTLRNQCENLNLAFCEFRKIWDCVAGRIFEKKPISRWAMPGPKIASPFATARIAASISA